MYYGDHDNETSCAYSLREIGGLNSQCKKHILPEHNAVGRRKTQEHRLYCNDRGDHEAWLSIDELKVGILAARSWKHAAKLN
jgi:hypothetical protein